MAGSLRGQIPKERPVRLAFADEGARTRPWELHHQVAAAAVRGAALGLLALALSGAELGAGLAVAAFVFAISVTEGRGLHPRDVLLRLAAGALAGALLAPFAAVWGQGIARGGPGGAYGRLGSVAGDLVEVAGAGTWGALVAACLLGPVFLERSRTPNVGSHLLGGVISAVGVTGSGAPFLRIGADGPPERANEPFRLEPGQVD